VTDNRTYETLPIRGESWYEPDTGDIERAAEIQARLAGAADEVEAHAIAHAWLRYVAKHCHDPAAAAAMLREVTEYITQAAERLNAAGSSR